MLGHGVGLATAPDLLLVCVQPGVGTEAHFTPVSLLAQSAGPRVVGPAHVASVRHPAVRVETPGQVRADQERGQRGSGTLPGCVH